MTRDASFQPSGFIGQYLKVHSRTYECYEKYELINKLFCAEVFLFTKHQNFPYLKKIIFNKSFSLPKISVNSSTTSKNFLFICVNFSWMNFAFRFFVSRKMNSTSQCLAYLVREKTISNYQKFIKRLAARFDSTFILFLFVVFVNLRSQDSYAKNF